MLLNTRRRQISRRFRFRYGHLCAIHPRNELWIKLEKCWEECRTAFWDISLLGSIVSFSLLKHSKGDCLRLPLSKVEKFEIEDYPGYGGKSLYRPLTGNICLQETLRTLDLARDPDAQDRSLDGGVRSRAG